VVSDWKKNIGGSTDLAKKARVGGFVYRYSLPLHDNLSIFNSTSLYHTEKYEYEEK